MTADAELAGTVDYASGWLVLAVALIVVVIGWNAGVALWGRPHRAVRQHSTPPDAAALRAEYLEMIDTVEAAYAAGSIGPREAYRRLSLASRGFVQALTGQATLSMTLTDLRERDLSTLVAVVEIAYPSVFAPPAERPAHELAATIERARAAVESTWS